MALFVFLLMLYVSQSAAVTVKVYEGDESVSLPFTVSGMDMKDPSALWSREGSSPEEVHLRDKKGDDLRRQSPQFKGRTEMRPDSLQTGDLSLVLKHPNASDSGVYTCEVKDGTTKVTHTSVQLIVISVNVTAVEGAESVSLPCTMRPVNMNNDPAALWTREGSRVHLRVKQGDDLRLQSPQFKGRTQMNPDALQTGDLSLVLFKTTTEDTGIYSCVVREGTTDMNRTTVELTVTKSPVPWDKIVGGVIGGFLGLSVIILSVLAIKRKKESNESFKEALIGLITRKPPTSVI